MISAKTPWRVITLHFSKKQVQKSQLKTETLSKMPQTNPVNSQRCVFFVSRDINKDEGFHKDPWCLRKDDQHPSLPSSATNRINSAQQICPEIIYHLPIWAPSSPQYVEKNHRSHHAQTQIIKHPIIKKTPKEGRGRWLQTPEQEHGWESW